jgi:hypothetical protein
LRFFGGVSRGAILHKNGGVVLTKITLEDE